MILARRGEKGRSTEEVETYMTQVVKEKKEKDRVLSTT
jgi:hypothetical protein